jgi:hypothetical protein
VANAPVDLAQALPRPDAASAELDGSDQSTSANLNQPQPFLPPPLFSDQDWGSMAAPPLWSFIYGHGAAPPLWSFTYGQENTSVPDTHSGHGDAVVPTEEVLPWTG